MLSKIKILLELFFVLDFFSIYCGPKKIIILKNKEKKYNIKNKEFFILTYNNKLSFKILYEKLEDP